jgi:IclR family pca regulon transcriptional regulator
MTTGQIGRKVGMSRAAVRRFLLTLEKLGFAQNIDMVYHLKPSMLRLGCFYLTSTSLPSLAQPLLENASELIHESTSLSVLDDDHIIYLARHTTSRVFSVGLSVGSRLPAYCTSMGRVLLADLPEGDLEAYLSRVKMKHWTSKTVTDKAVLMDLLRRVATDRYAIVDGELEPGLRSIAVPVQTSAGLTIAAINAGVHIASSSREEMIARILPVLRQQAAILAKLL